MSQLQLKLSEELKPSGEIVVCRFPLPDSHPHETIGEGIDAVWLYRQKK